MRKKITLTFFCLLLLLAISAGAFWIFKPYLKNEAQNKIKATAEPITMALGDISLDSELVELSVRGDIAKIEVITPGLDTYSMRIVIYDIKNSRVLSETEFPEGSYATGITDKGFYVAKLTEKSFYLYGNDGALRDKQTFSEAEKWSYVCAVSEDENYFVYSDLESGKIFVHDISNELIKTFSMDSAYVAALGFYGGELYCKGADGEVVRINAETSEVHIAFNDRRLIDVTPSHGIGRTEYNFLSATENAKLYITPFSADEIVVGVDEKNFTTAVINGDKTILRIYDLAQNTVTKTTVDDTVQSVHSLTDGRILVHTGNSMEKRHSLCIYDISDCSKSELTASTEDKPKLTVPGKTTPEAELSDNAVIVENVPLIAQFPDFPTGCESVSAVMALRFAGEKVSVSDFVNGFLPKSNNFYYENGINYGPSPYEYFIGNPRTASSYGCMAPVIEKALCDYFGNTDRVINTTGTQLSELCSNYIDNGIPVMVWATINMVETNPKNSWYLSDSKRFTWPGNEHCMVLIGYDSGYYYFNDPYSGAVVKYEKGVTEDRYAELGFQSVVVLKK